MDDVREDDMVLVGELPVTDVSGCEGHGMPPRKSRKGTGDAGPVAVVLGTMPGVGDTAEH